MNLQIQQLAEQALEYAEKNQSADIPRHWFRLYNEKFAELIIKECLTQVDKMRDVFEADGEDEQALGAEWVGLAIAKHFGVES